MSDNRKFQKGSGVYTCGWCGKYTRETGSGESKLELCAACMRIAETENAHSDHDHDGNVWDCEECKTKLRGITPSEIEAYKNPK